MLYKKIELADLANQQAKCESTTALQDEVMKLISAHFALIADQSRRNDSLLEWQNLITEMPSLLAEQYDLGYQEANDLVVKTRTQQDNNEVLGASINVAIEKINGSKGELLQVAEACTTLLTTLASKLALILPQDFKRIIEEHILKLIENLHIPGKITFIVNPERVDYCQQILQEHKMMQYEVLADESIEQNDCRAIWQNSKLEYNTADITAQALALISNLK